MKRRNALGKSFMRQMPPHKTGFLSNPRYRKQENENDLIRKLYLTFFFSQEYFRGGSVYLPEHLREGA